MLIIFSIWQVKNKATEGLSKLVDFRCVFLTTWPHYLLQWAYVATMTHMVLDVFFLISQHLKMEGHVKSGLLSWLGDSVTPKPYPPINSQQLALPHGLQLGAHCNVHPFLLSYSTASWQGVFWIHDSTWQTVLSTSLWVGKEYTCASFSVVTWVLREQKYCPKPYTPPKSVAKFCSSGITLIQCHDITTALVTTHRDQKLGTRLEGDLQGC